MDNKDNNNNSIFRKKTLDSISSPDQLTNYLKVTNPGIWLVFAAVIVFLVGLFVWAKVGTLETKAPARIVVVDDTALVSINSTKELKEGMPLRIASEEYMIASVKKDEYGRTLGIAQVDLPDGNYDGTVVVDKTHPIDFLLESR